MTPDTQQARAGHRRPQGKRRDAGATVRSVPLAAEPAQTGHAQEDASIVRVVPLLAVLVVAVAGVYLAWRQSSAGGRDGGVVAGCALLAAAAFRLLLPDGLTGLLAVRSRRTDVGVLVAFGIGLLVMGLVLPR
jgi:hypothetical protein